MTKRAVVVGINDYSAQVTRGPELGLGWHSLQGCLYDAGNMYHLLRSAFGFDEVVLLRDAEATRSNILGSLRSLIDQSEAGDVACFYFSGHGGILPASKEPTNSRFYEAIIPYSGDWIFDRRIAEMADRLRPSEVNFTLIMDSCHSGGLHPADENQQSVPKSVPFSPGTAETLHYLQTLIPCGACVPPGVDPFANNVQSITIRPDGIDLDADPDRTLVQQAKATLFSACQYFQTAGDSSAGGLFTLSLLDFVQHPNFEASYEEVLEGVRRRMFEGLGGPVQTPQLYGQLGRTDEGFLQPWNASE